GDRFTGTLYHQQYFGHDNAQVMNLLGYDVMTLGNHEFDNGDDVLSLFVDALEFPVVNANIDFSGNATLSKSIVPFAVLEVSGESIGVTGLITPDTPSISSPGEELVFSEDLVGTAQAAIDELIAQDINKIVLLTHIGIEVDKVLIPQLSGVDIVIGAHSHTLISNLYAGGEDVYPIEFTSASGEPVVYVTAKAVNEYLGRLDVEFDTNGVLVDWGGDVILLSRYIEPDVEMAALVTALAAPLEELKTTVVGETSVFLVGDRAVCRAAECNLGNLITDAVRAETGAQIAFENGGGIRADIDEGEVTLGEVLTVLPFGNLVSTFELSGADVWAALENGVSQVEEGAGRFAQVSGLRYTWDGSQEPGSRIISVDVLNPTTGEYEPIDLEQIYTVAANDFMRRGGDEYTVFAENAIDPYDYGTPLDVVVAEYIAANSPVAPEVEGRITRVDQ
ncbi:MAG: multifunctional 2',3'-cyclic-nucleotide 2'-phosphodiesterase/5'-nucleotidase/3'-nucleotidase, partial [Chloroflexi bacterium]